MKLLRIKKISFLFLFFSFGIFLSSCATSSKQKILPDPDYAAVFPTVNQDPKQVTGSLYDGAMSDSWFGRRTDFEVGDIVVVILDEKIQADRTQTTDVKRDTTNEVAAGILGKLPIIKNNVGGLDVDGSSISSNGSGSAGQEATLQGQISVTVVQILPNGNLIVRGEKKLELSEGSEVIRVAGIVRTEDIAPNGTVFSRRLANAQISYIGSGELASANRVPWGASLLLQFWPF
jgi:flagellar L-ring protein precursor FlgH